MSVYSIKDELAYINDYVDRKNRQLESTRFSYFVLKPVGGRDPPQLRLASDLRQIQTLENSNGVPSVSDDSPLRTDSITPRTTGGVSPSTGKMHSSTDAMPPSTGKMHSSMVAMTASTGEMHSSTGAMPPSTGKMLPYINGVSTYVNGVFMSHHYGGLPAYGRRYSPVLLAKRPSKAVDIIDPATGEKILI